DILAGAIQLRLLKGSKAIPLKSQAPAITSTSSGAASWQTILTAGDIKIVVMAKMECDGYINYEVRNTSKRKRRLDDIQLEIPYHRSNAKYIMDMGKRGGKIPHKLKWKWEQEYANNMRWIGDVNAGMQLKLKHL